MEYFGNLNSPCPPYMSKQKCEYIYRLHNATVVLEESIFAACVIKSTQYIEGPLYIMYSWSNE